MTAITTILDTCKNLVRLESSVMEEFLLYNQSFSTICSSYNMRHITLSLKHHHLSLQTVCSLFPSLEELKILSVNHKQLQSFNCLTQLDSLRYLVVGSVSLDYLKTSLGYIGYNLVSFCLASPGGLIDLSVIQNCCTHLKILSLTGQRIITKEEFIFKNGQIFPCLRDLHINTFYPLPSSMVRIILSHSPSLAKVDLSHCQAEILSDISSCQY